jgi:tetratricopeptide (TPR) repeat protein
MTIPKLALAVLATLVFSVASFAEDSKDKAAPIGPPQPRVVAPLQKAPLPPRAEDPSWLLYQEGIKLYDEKRLGESLVAFQKAARARSELFSRCSEDVDSAMAAKEAKRAKDSLSELVRLLAARDMIPQAYEAIYVRAGGSIVAEMGLIRETSPTAPLRGLIDATLLVVEEKGLSRIGDSLRALQKAVRDLMLYPEAESWIGKVYLAEGELRLAELQFQHAYGMIGSLELAQDRQGMLEALAGIYKSEGNLKDYESSLRVLADASDLFANKDSYFRNAMERVLAERGFDKFMSLYRIDQGDAAGAYSALGELYLNAGRPIATIYLAAAVDATLTSAINEIKIDEPGYSYAGLQDLLARILADQGMSRFADESDLWKDLVLLGKALAASGYRDTAREIWTAAAKVRAPDPWGSRAADALAMPASASMRP